MNEIIKFVRVQRDSMANKQRRENGDTRHIVYDFHVLINGEHRAILARNVHSVGYTLHDADHHNIHEIYENGNLSRHAREVKSQALFETVIREELARGRIPTLGQMVDLRSAEADKKARNRAEQAERDRIGMIREAALDLYDAAKALLEHGSPATIETLRAAVAKAETKVERDDE